MTDHFILKDFELFEVSAVDRPAQEGARLVLMKRDDSGETRPLTDEDRELLAKNASLVLTTDEDGHAHLLDASASGMTSHSKSPDEEFGHAHPYVVGADGKITIGAADGHVHRARMTKALSPEDLAKLGSEGLQSEPDAAAAGGGNDTKNREDAEMAKHDEQNAAGTEDQAVEKRVEDLTKANERLTLVVGMSPGVRKHFDSLDEAGQDEFLKLDEGAQRREIEKAAEADSVVYTADDGSEFRKSDDPRLVQMAKDRDEDRRKLAKSEADRYDGELTKRAGDDLGNLPGDVDVRKELLKAVDGIADEGVRGKVFDALRASNTAIAKAFEATGTAATPKSGSAQARLDELAKAHQTANPELTFEKAYAAVAKTKEGQELILETMGR